MKDLDIGAVFAALFTAFLGPKLGPVIGIYSVIAIAAIVGAGFALARREPGARPGPVAFVVLLVVATMITTVPITLLLVSYLPVVAAQVAAPLVALAIAGIGQDWTRVFVWAWGFARRWVGQRTGVSDQSSTPGGTP